MSEIKLRTLVLLFQCNYHYQCFYSNLAAFVNIIKVNIGTGVLAMPNAFANAGLALGLGFMALIYIIFIHSMLLLVSTSHYVWTYYHYFTIHTSSVNKEILHPTE